MVRNPATLNMGEERIHLDPDGCVVLELGAGDFRLFVPDPAQTHRWIAPETEFSRIVRDPVSGLFQRVQPDGTIHRYRADGTIQSKTDRFGLVMLYDYSAGLLAQVTTATGYYYSFSYDGNNKLQLITDSAGRVSQFTVDGNNDLVSFLDPESNERTFEYDANHQLMAQNGTRGERSEYDFSNGRVTEVRAYDTDGMTLLRTRQMQPSALNGEMSAALVMGLGTLNDPIPVVTNRIDTTTDGRGFTSSHESDSTGLTSITTDNLGRQHIYSYNQQGLVESQLFPNGSISEYDYNNDGFLTEVRDYQPGPALYRSVQAVYTNNDNYLVQYTDAEGITTQLSYDRFGNLIVIEDHEGHQTTMHYDHLLFPNLLTAVVGPEGQLIEFDFDSHGNMISRTDYPDLAGPGRTASYIYDNLGRMTSYSPPKGGSYSFTYDLLNRVLTSDSPIGNLIEYDYGTPGCNCATFAEEVTLANAASFQFEYDGLNRLTQRTDLLGNSSNFSYDGESNLIAFLNRNGQQMTYAYDPVGNLVAKVDPVYGDSTFEYDESGNITHAANADSQMDQAFDFLGRMTEQTSRMTFDLAGNRVRQPITVEYVYDKVGSITQVFDDHGYTNISKSYDYMYHVQQLIDQVGGIQWDFIYDISGRPISRTASTGAQTMFAYDQVNQLESLHHMVNNPVSVDILSVDANGNFESIVRTNNAAMQQLDLTFDLADRLTQVDDSTSFGDVRVTTNESFNQANQISSHGEYAISYDLEGQLVTKTHLGTGIEETFEYDADGRLRRVIETYDDGGGAQQTMSAEYLYDPFGRRTAKRVNGVVTQYLYHGQSPVAELDGRNALKRTYLYGAYVDELLSFFDPVAAESFTVHTDHQYSVLGIADAKGDPVEDYVYDAYGLLVAQSDPFLFPITSMGREMDYETGTYYFRNRQYDPNLGVFMSQDPLSVSSNDINSYGFLLNSPMMNLDPYGLEGTSVSYQRLSYYYTYQGNGYQGATKAHEDYYKQYPGAYSCAVRVSHALRNATYGSGTEFFGSLPKGTHNWRDLPINADQLARILSSKFGPPQSLKDASTPYSGPPDGTGIIFYDFDPGSLASGHITLWDGKKAVDGNSYPNAPRIYFWRID